MSEHTDEIPTATVTNFPSGADDPWSGIETPPGYTLSDRGVFLEPTGPKGSPVSIAAPVWVTAQARNGEGRNWGLLLEWLDSDRNRRQLAITRSRLHESGGTLVQDLADHGLAVVPGKERALMTYLGTFEPTERVRSVDRLGWLAESVSGAGIAYVLPAQVIGGDNVEPIHFQPERHSPSADTMRAQGTLEAWQREVASPLAGNPFLVFALSVSFAAPLLKSARLEAGGFHLYGRSSHGKTTAAQVAASVWGCGADPAEAPDKAYIRRWNTTANALEGLAAAHNDGLLVLDEIGTCGAHDFGRIVYDLMGGQGKAAMNSERALRQVRSWRSLVLSTGEISVAQRVQQDGGRQPHAGQRVRFMDLPAGGSVITAPDSGSDAAVYAQALKRACADCYGTAGPAFLEALIGGYSTEAALSDAVRNRLEEACARLAVPGLPAEAVRALDRLALVLVAGEWAAEAGIVPLEQAEIGSAVDFVRRGWLADGGHIAEGDRGVMTVRDFILRHGSRFADASDSGGPDVRDLVGYIDKRYQLYLFTPEGFAEACQGMDPRQVSTALKERGLLATNEGDRHQSKRSIPAKGDRRIRVYAVRMGIVEVGDGVV